MRMFSSPRLILGIGRAADVAAAALQLGAQLLLREAAGVAQAAQIVAKIAIPPYSIFSPPNSIF